MLKSTALAAILAAFICVPASQASLVLTGDSVDLELSGYDLDTETGLVNTDIVQRLLPTGALSLTGKADVTFTYLGTEAGHKNFFYNGIEFFDSKTSDAGTATFTATNVSAGILDFYFQDFTGSGSVANGFVGVSPYISIALFLEAGGTWLALFNDNCACDTDFDDMAVRISASPVPIPAALPLFAAGLAGLGWLSRRRSSGTHLRPSTSE